MSRFGPFPDPGRLLEQDEAEAAFATMLDGGGSDEDVAAFLAALSDRGETMVEIAAAAQAMRDRLIPIDAPDGAIDVCGTGGDGHHTLNVSTAVSIVVAACEVPVAKHGNRAASSKSGAADTLEALGLDMARASEMAEAQLADLGICFLFAAHHHPAMARIMPIRRALGRRTIFNLMGPLANPARVRRQLIGIARPAYVPVYAQALHRLGTDHSRVISGDEGIDELSLAGGNEVAVPGGAHLDLHPRTRSGAGALKYVDTGHLHLDRLPSFSRQQSGDWLQVNGNLPAKSAANFHWNHGDFGNRRVQHFCDGVTSGEGPLGAGPDLQLAVGIPKR